MPRNLESAATPSPRLIPATSPDYVLHWSGVQAILTEKSPPTRSKFFPEECRFPADTDGREPGPLHILSRAQTGRKSRTHPYRGGTRRRVPSAHVQWHREHDLHLRAPDTEQPVSERLPASRMTALMIIRRQGSPLRGWSAAETLQASRTDGDAGGLHRRSPIH